MKRIVLIYALLVCFATAIASCQKSQRIAVLGDSMTWIGGDSCQNARGWTYHFKRIVNPAAIDIYARSGATWTNTSKTTGDTEAYSEVLSDENVIYTQMLRLQKAVAADSSRKPDVILIYAGANDAWFADRRPGIFDLSDDKPASEPGKCTSLAASVRLVCQTLRNEYPYASLYVMTPVEMTKVSVDRVKKISDIIESAVAGMNVEVFRGDKDVDIRSANEKKAYRLTTDGVHTSPEGAAMIAEYLASKILR